MILTSYMHNLIFQTLSGQVFYKPTARAEPIQLSQLLSETMHIDSDPRKKYWKAYFLN